MGDEVVYVGKSKSILSRLHDHVRDKQFTNVILHECSSEDEMSKREIRDIEKLAPVFNKAGLPGTGDLHKKRLLNKVQSVCPNCLARVYPDQYMIDDTNPDQSMQITYYCGQCQLEFSKHRQDIWIWELQRYSLIYQTQKGVLCKW